MIISVFVIVAVFIGTLFFLFKYYERIVCTEVCNIYCNAIVAFDQFVGESQNISEEWQKFAIKSSLSKEIESKEVERVLQMLEMKKKHLQELYTMMPKFTYNSSIIKQFVLSRHKLPLQEIELAIVVPRSTYEELNSIVDNAMSYVKADKIDQLQISFVQTVFKAFEHETYGMFYSALEGICSFPSQALRIYNEVANQIKYLPKSVGCSKRKEDYLHFQEIEMNKAQSILNDYNTHLNDIRAITGEYVDVLLKLNVNMFFSGSKSLEAERNIFNGVVVRQQTRWRDKGIDILGYSYQNFPHEVVEEGHQAKYDEFIQCCTDAIFFVLNGNVGGYTQKEFDLAMQSFCKTGKPKIFVYSMACDTENESVEALRNAISQRKQYWQDYKDNEQLKLLMENDMSGVIVDVCDKNNELRRKILE